MKRKYVRNSADSCAKRQKIEPCCFSSPLLLNEASRAANLLVCRAYSRSPAGSPSTSGQTFIAAPIAQTSENKDGLWMIVGLGNPGV
jgi:hypothetical protein